MSSLLKSVTANPAVLASTLPLWKSEKLQLVPTLHLAMEADATSGKTNICKNCINKKLRLKICILIYLKNAKS